MKTITKALAALLVLASFVMLTGCNKPSSVKKILSFKIFEPAVEATIMESAKTVIATVPEGTNVTALVPIITVSDKAMVNPASGVPQNFTTSKTYTVTAEDGTQAVYTVTVVIGSGGGGNGDDNGGGNNDDNGGENGDDNGDDNGGGNGVEVAHNYTVSVSASPTAGGNVSGDGTYEEGQSCTVTATANDGYSFSSWTEGGDMVSDSASYTFVVDCDRNLVANFIVNPQPTYTIMTSANPTNGGTTTGEGTYEEGQLCTVTATANDGYSFAYWIEKGNLVSDSASYTFAVDRDRNLVANFTVNPQPTYTITTSANPADGGTIIGGGTYNEGESVTLRANANTNYIFDHWQDGSTTNPRSITVTASAAYTAYFTYNVGGTGNGNANGHAYVDLGLPSGTLWATCNVGANTPEDYGSYYAWGETATKTTYNWSTYQWCNGDWDQLTKYCNESSHGNNGFTDNLITLQLGDDVARANWGGDWRMPTKAEWEELLNNTTETWTTQNGVNGRKFTASNGNSLFLPAAGVRCDSSLMSGGTHGGYWSSSLSTDCPHDAWRLNFMSGSCYVGGGRRDSGSSVRAVLPALQN